jgi:hypothetical protein
MKSGTTFLLAARQCEIADLERLAETGALVATIGRFIHSLQRERGLSNVYLASAGTRFGPQRLAQVAESRLLEAEVRAGFDLLDTEAGHLRNGSRLFNRVALVLHSLEGLPQLRERVAGRQLTASDATAAYIRLVAGLLAVVFEAADSATDPEISRALVALFNFMQGKEFAGQERACGAAVFAAGRGDATSQARWRHLIEMQGTCFQVFDEFAAPEAVRTEREGQDFRILAEIERLRRIGCTPEAKLDANLSQVWFDACTHRIDAMRSVEDALAAHLRGLCDSKIAQARLELRDQRALLEGLTQQAALAPGDQPAPFGPQLERSILAMVQEQSRRLQAVSDELDTVRASLNERKVIERAKGLLMAHRHLSEDDAYKTLRQMAMNQNRRLVDVADAVLAMAEVLPPPAPR